MVKKINSNNGQLSLLEVVDSVKNHFETAKYSVATFSDKFEVGLNVKATKNKEKFLIFAVGEKEDISDIIRLKELLFAIGEVLRKMEKRDLWTFYGIAIPKSYFRLLKDFEVAGIELLNFHLLIVENIWSLYHLDTKATIELIQDLKMDKPERLMNLDIDFKNYDYGI